MFNCTHCGMFWQLLSDDCCCDISITSSAVGKKGQLWAVQFSLANIIVQAPVKHNWLPGHTLFCKTFHFLYFPFMTREVMQRQGYAFHIKTFSCSMLGTWLVLFNCVSERPFSMLWVCCLFQIWNSTRNLCRHKTKLRFFTCLSHECL